MHADGIVFECVSNANLFLAAVAEELLIAPEEPDTVRKRLLYARVISIYEAWDGCHV